MISIRRVQNSSWSFGKVSASGSSIQCQCLNLHIGHLDLWHSQTQLEDTVLFKFVEAAKSGKEKEAGVSDFGECLH